MTYIQEKDGFAHDFFFVVTIWTSLNLFETENYNMKWIVLV